MTTASGNDKKLGLFTTYCAGVTLGMSAVALQVYIRELGCEKSSQISYVIN